MYNSSFALSYCYPLAQLLMEASLQVAAVSQTLFPPPQRSYLCPVCEGANWRRMHIYVHMYFKCFINSRVVRTASLSLHPILDPQSCFITQPAAGVFLPLEVQ